VVSRVNKFIALANATSSTVASNRAFDHMGIQRELSRRDRIRDAIDCLSSVQRDAARADEKERQRRWDEARRKHLSVKKVAREAAAGAAPKASPAEANGSAVDGICTPHDSTLWQRVARAFSAGAKKRW
jgi:hypothetical protein